RPSGHARAERTREGRAQHTEAVSTESHRQRARRTDLLAAVAWGRSHLPEQPVRELQPEAQQEDVPRRHGVHPVATGARWPPGGGRVDQARFAQDQAAGAEVQGHEARFRAGDRRRGRREPVPGVAQPRQRAGGRAALRRSAVAGALQEGAGHQGRHRPAQGDVRMSRINPTPKERQFDEGRLMQVLVAPVISEKATMVAEKSNAVTFKVLRSATKPEIKAAVELLFNVKVRGVSVANIKGKTKRFGRSIGRRDHVRKAYVLLQEGQELNLSGEAALAKTVIKHKPTTPGRTRTVLTLSIIQL